MRIDAPTYSLRDLYADRPVWRRERHAAVALTGESRDAAAEAETLPGLRPVPAESAGRAEERPEQQHGQAAREHKDPAPPIPGQRKLTSDQEREVSRLRAVDQQVRAHEQAHLAAAGGIARGGASLSFVTGPDGRQYAVGGEVQIDTSAVSGSPEQTLMKARAIEAAAMAPADPSPQDRRVAAMARQMALDARHQASERDTRRLEARQEGGPDPGALARTGSRSAPDPRIRAYTASMPSAHARSQGFSAVA